MNKVMHFQLRLITHSSDGNLFLFMSFFCVIDEGKEETFFLFEAILQGGVLLGRILGRNAKERKKCPKQATLSAQVRGK